jgi:hypothetical protein
MRFLWAKGLNEKDIHKEMFSVYVGKCLSRKRFTNESRNSLKDVRKSQMMPDQARKWLRQQSNDFYAASFDALVKQRDKCSSVDGAYIEKYMFFPRFEYHMFYVLSLALSLLSHKTKSRSPFLVLKPASEHGHALLLHRLSWRWTALLASDTHRKPITAILLPFVTYLL